MANTRIEELLAHAEWLRRLAVGLTRGDDPDDLVQDTWLSALRSPPDAAVPAQPWLATVLRNFALRRWRRSGVRARAHAALAEANPVEGTGSVVERAQVHRALAHEVLALDEPFRTTVLLRYFEGLSSVEIARSLGVPAGTVRWRLKEGLDRIRRQLDAGGDDWRPLLLPLVPDSGSLPRAGLPAAPALVLVGAGLAGIGLATALALRPAGPPAPAPAERARAVTTADRPTQKPTTEEEAMLKERLRKTATLFGVVLPVLVASASEAGKPVPREQAVAVCIDYWGWAYQCREEFAAYSAAQPPAGKNKSGRTETQEERRRRMARELEHAGPLEARQKECEAQVERRWQRTESEVRALRACIASSDCKAAVACALPLIDEWRARGK